MKRSTKFIVVFFIVLISGIFFVLMFHRYSYHLTPYGNNSRTGKFIELNGINMYYEEYGKGMPLLIIHQNGGTIKSMRKQIEYFKSNYRVIAADSRGQGKTELNTDSLTYVQMANDLSKLTHKLQLDSVSIIGWSDGGIIALLMGINHPENIRKIVAMSANLRPDSTAIKPSIVTDSQKQKELLSKEYLKNPLDNEIKLRKQLMCLLVDQPKIPNSDLKKIKNPVLIMAGENDIIRNQHTLEIFHNIDNARLHIMPNGSHSAILTEAKAFNRVVEKFLLSIE